MKVSVLGATGYAGAELLRILYQHPQADVVHITSESHTGESIASLYPHLRGLYDMKLESMQDIRAIGEDSDFIFIGLPHGHAMEVARALADLPVRIIDLGADFRFDDTAVYEAWYHVKHTYADAPRVYGLAELYRDAVRSAKIIGNAGCFTTASILALAPLAKSHLIDTKSIIVDAKSGVTGAGRSPKLANHFPELYDNFRAYNVAHHRHTPEIEQAVADLSDEETLINFYTRVRPWGWWKPIEEKALARYPHIQPNRNFKRDAFNVAIGIVWQCSLTIIPMYLVVRQQLGLWSSIALLLVTTLILRKTWYKPLCKEEIRYNEEIKQLKQNKE